MTVALDLWWIADAFALAGGDAIPADITITSAVCVSLRTLMTELPSELFP
jgi:hypothetical protein